MREKKDASQTLCLLFNFAGFIINTSYHINHYHGQSIQLLHIPKNGVQSGIEKISNFWFSRSYHTRYVFSLSYSDVHHLTAYYHGSLGNSCT